MTEFINEFIVYIDLFEYNTFEQRVQRCFNYKPLCNYDYIVFNYKNKSIDLNNELIQSNEFTKQLLDICNHMYKQNKTPVNKQELIEILQCIRNAGFLVYTINTNCSCCYCKNINLISKFITNDYNSEIDHYKIVMFLVNNDLITCENICKLVYSVADHRKHNTRLFNNDIVRIDVQPSSRLGYWYLYIYLEKESNTHLLPNLDLILQEIDNYNSLCSI